MNIKETIMHYITVYYGSGKRVIQNTVSDFLYQFKKRTDAERTVNASLDWLLENKYIKVVDYQEMTDMEKRYFESDGYCTIYRKLKRFNESEYLQERYNN